MYIIFLVGVFLVYLSIRANKKRKWLASNGIRVPGVVVGQVEEEMNGRDLFFPVVKVDDPVLGTREIRLSTGTNIQLQIGSKIVLVYPPDDPDQIRELSESRTFVNIAMLIAGLFFGIVGFVWIVVSLLWDYFMSH